jgi:hypothetical protein
MATPTEPSHIQADPKLKDDPEFIQQQICPAFLNWLLEGMAVSIADGIDYTTGSQAMQDVRRASCHLWDFCDAIGLTYEDGASASTKRVCAKSSRKLRPNASPAKPVSVSLRDSSWTHGLDYGRNLRPIGRYSDANFGRKIPVSIYLFTSSDANRGKSN